MNRQGRSGFTLIEILLVMVIILVLASMVVPNLAGKGKQAKIAAARADIEANLATALDLYELDNGRYPTTGEGLSALIQNPHSSASADNWNGPYLKKQKTPQDPWGREYVYAGPGVHHPEGYDLSSYGPDGIESKDDIVNWEEARSSK